MMYVIFFTWLVNIIINDSENNLILFREYPDVPFKINVSVIT